MLRKEVTGYAAFDKESDKVDFAPTEEIVKTHIIWFNNTHKNQKEFVIKKVVRVTEIQEVN